MAWQIRIGPEPVHRFSPFPAGLLLGDQARHVCAHRPESALAHPLPEPRCLRVGDVDADLYPVLATAHRVLPGVRYSAARYLMRAGSRPLRRLGHYDPLLSS